MDLLIFFRSGSRMKPEINVSLKGSELNSR